MLYFEGITMKNWQAVPGACSLTVKCDWDIAVGAILSSSIQQFQGNCYILKENSNKS